MQQYRYFPDKHENLHFETQEIPLWVNRSVGRVLTFGKAQLLCNRACDFGGGGVAVEVDLIHAVPVHVGATQLQTVDGCNGPAKQGQTHTRGNEQGEQCVGIKRQ